MDPANVKAWHRKAQALHRLNEWDAAIEAAQAGMKIDPDNKVFSELVEKANQDKAKDVEDKAKLKRDAQDAKVELHNASTARAPVKKKMEAENASSTLFKFSLTMARFEYNTASLFSGTLSSSEIALP
mmetsp:Transcript_6842/g.9471  ORF Transcript_6842/g.9471 Transcript_6842/m.9471 type:complete len:128 (-) Transcript_6842:169-552(-)